MRTAGRGAHLLLAHGSAAQQSRWARNRPQFEDVFTVTTFDRRGRGESGDAEEYAFGREVEDLLAVVEALDPPLLLLGHSFGGLIALEAARQADRLRGLVLYEPPIPGPDRAFYDDAVMARLEHLIARGENEQAITTFLADIARVAAADREMLRAAPTWAERVASAPVLPREMRAQNAYRIDRERAAKLALPVLLLLGGESTRPFADATRELEEVLPDARLEVMPGQRHNAMDTAPDIFFGAVRRFHEEIS